jgi:hypothetical protein
MRKIFIVYLLSIGSMADSQNNQVPTLRSVLLKQLKATHNVKEWYVPADSAVADLTPDQANWKDGSDNHSIAQLASHLLFWNAQSLANFKGEKPASFDGDNKETFSSVDEKTWKETIRKLDSVYVELENLISTADESKLNKWAPTLANINIHNAYHTGQILYIRKMKGWWDDAKGVK